MEYTLQDEDLDILVIEPSVKKQVAKLDVSMETEEYDLYERSTQTVVSIDEEVQTEAQKPGEIRVSKKGILKFLETTVPLMCEMLEKNEKSRAFDDYDVNWDDENEQNKWLYTLSAPRVEEDIVATITSEETTGDFFDKADVAKRIIVRASALAWSAQGTNLGIGYSRLDTSGWDQSQSIIHVWSLFRKDNSKPTYEIETEGGVTALSFHPNQPSILAAGSYNGIVSIYNLQRSDYLISASVIDEYQHRETVYQLVWQITPMTQPQLYSVSQDGKILHWLTEKLDSHCMDQPLRGFAILNKKVHEGGMWLSFSSQDYNTIITGTEAGNVFRGTIAPINTERFVMDASMKWKRFAELVINNTPERSRYELKNAAEEYCGNRNIKEVPVAALFAHKPDLRKVFNPFIQFRYEKSAGPVIGLSCSEIHRNLFATASTDGSVRVYNMLQTQSIMMFEPSPEFYLRCISWSPVRPLVLAVGSANGSVYIYDLVEDDRAPVCVLEQPEGMKVEVEKIAFNKYVRDFVAISYSSGQVQVFQLESKLANIQPGEMQKLSSIIEIS